MNLKITASNLVTRHYLAVRDEGVEFCETAALGSARRFRFEQIDAVFRGGGKIAFQVGQEIFKIPVDDRNGMHRATVARLVAEARRTVRKRI